MHLPREEVIELSQPLGWGGGVTLTLTFAPVELK